MAIAAGFPPQIQNLIQQNVLEREFHDSLFPAMLYRSEAMDEEWAANLGERHIFTRAGTMPVKTAPLTPGQDPTPTTYETEQWVAEASQHGDNVDTNMASNYVTLASLFMRDSQQLGLNAGQTLNRLARNPMYLNYLGGETNALAAAAGAATSVTVASIAGFTEILVNGRLEPVSSANPLAVTFPGGTEAGNPNTVVGAIPQDAVNFPFGTGTLLFGTPLTTGIAARDVILAASATIKQRVGGADSIDGITPANIVTLNDVIAAVSRLRAQNVPPHGDGRYHVHITPQAEQQLFTDNHWQRMQQSLPDNAPYRELMIGEFVGCYFYRNTENPNVDTVSNTQSVGTNAISAPEIGADLVNDNGVTINRILVTGGGALYERYLNENKFLTEAGTTGKIGNFNIINGGVSVTTERIRFILRAPSATLQQIVSQTWSWSGDFPVPSDGLSGDAARFKRAIAIEHA